MGSQETMKDENPPSSAVAFEELSDPEDELPKHGRKISDYA